VHRYLRPGTKAEIVVLRLTDLNMLTAERDPIAAVVTAANPGKVETVLVNGRPVTTAGRLAFGDLAPVVAAMRATAAALNA
jgi:5-methylthioadenosine/S-adenosylhomocysteine deaminase